MVDYFAYIGSPEWYKTRSNYFRSNPGAKCCVCGSKDNLNLHHKSYKRLGKERMSDLMPLCRSCHADTHNHLGIYHPKLRKAMLWSAVEVMIKDRKKLHIPVAEKVSSQKPVSTQKHILRKGTGLASPV